MNANSFPRTPALTLHRSTGQAYVRLDGRCHYLGKYGLPETQQKYHQLLAEWMAGGHRTNATQETITIVEVMDLFWQHAQSYYLRPDGKPSGEQGHFKIVIRMLKGLYGPTPAAQFGPLALKAVREGMIRGGWCRRNVNFNINRIRRIFRWAVENELISGSILHALQAVAGLRRGRCNAKETEPVKPVPMNLVEAVKPFVSRQVWAVIELQRLTAARGGELVIMRPCDVDTSGDIWLYKPAEHKTAYHGHERTIYIGPEGQKVLRPFLLRPAESYCFSPAEADAERRREQAQARVTPLSCGNRPGTNRVASPKKKPRDRYDSSSYARAIQYACDHAFPPQGDLAQQPEETRQEWKKRLTAEQKARLAKWRKEHRWHPHQLRHNAATEIRRQFGLETARIILGHRSPVITEIYAEMDKEKALAAMLKFG